MVINLITGAKGGIGKTFLTFLYFISALKNETGKRYIFIDHNHMNADFFNILRNTSIDSKSISGSYIKGGVFKYAKITDNIKIVWNDSQHYFPQHGVNELIKSISDILADTDIINFTKQEETEIFIDSNFHFRIFYSRDDNEQNDLKNSLTLIKDLGVNKFRVLFVWAFSLLLENRKDERAAIEETVKTFSSVWCNDNIIEDEFNNSVLFPKENELIQEKNIEKKKELLWAMQDFYQILNYYIPFQQGFGNKVLKVLEKYSLIEKCSSKGISFHYINDKITKLHSIIDAENLNFQKMKVLDTLTSILTREQSPNKKSRPKNILVIPQFHSFLSGFTERMSENEIPITSKNCLNIFGNPNIIKEIIEEIKL